MKQGALSAKDAVEFLAKKEIDRFWSSEDIDLQNEKVYRIDKIPVLTFDKLGDSIIFWNILNSFYMA